MVRFVLLLNNQHCFCKPVQGERLKEAQNINKSLSALGDVIQALQQRSGHIPFRNSKVLCVCVRLCVCVCVVGGGECVWVSV